MILGLFTGLLEAGGIERISRHAAAVLTLFARERDETCCLLSLNDPPGHHEVQVGNIAFTLQGFGRHKRAFVLAALRHAGKTSLDFLNHPNLAPLGLLIRLFNPRARYVVASYGIDVWSPLPFYRRICLQRAQAVTALSQFTADKLMAIQCVVPDKVILLPPAIDAEFFERDGCRQGWAVPRSPGKLLLTVARLASSERYKGIETVFHALPRVLTAIPDAYYVIVGDGDDRPRLEQVSKELGVSDHVRFAGHVGEEALASYYDTCDIFVMPSRGEGFGLVFLEAMAFGKPIIGGNHGGTPDVVVDGITGFLVEYGDVETLADRIICLLRDDDLRRRMGEAGRQRVLENYTFDHFRKRFMAILKGAYPCAS